MVGDRVCDCGGGGGGDGIGRGIIRPIKTTVDVIIQNRTDVNVPLPSLKAHERQTDTWLGTMVASIELLQQSTFVVFLGLLISLTTVYFSCESASRCVKAGDCTRLSLESSKYIPQCNFVRTPGTLGALEYSDPTAFPNQTAETSNTVLRAYCAPGERLEAAASGGVVCTQQYPYPNAISREIQSTLPTPPTLDSDRMCGAWIGAGEAPDSYSASYWAFSGVDREIDAVQRRQGSSRGSSGGLSRSNIGKLTEKCTHIVNAGQAAIIHSVTEAYRHLVTESAIEGVNDTDSALKSMGVIIGHYCDGPVSIGWNYADNQVSGLAFSATMYESSVPIDDATMGQAMQVVGEDTNSIALAVRVNAEVKQATQRDVGGDGGDGGDVGDEVLATLERVYEGASGRLDHANVRLQSGPVHGLMEFKKHTVSDVSDAKAYLKGLAATCSFTASNGQAAPPQDFGGRVAISALGRLKRKRAGGGEPMREIDRTVMHNATSATLSQLSIGGDGGCAAYAEALFPDTIDAERFSVIYSESLYQKLEAVTRRIRQGVAGVLREDERVRKTLSDPDKVARDVDQVRLRIPGAPRGSWAGASRSLPHTFFDSSDSFLSMVLKQARAVFLDRQGRLVYEATDVCEGPPVMDSLEANAYIYPSVHCSYYLLGLSLRPFLDPTFDEESILSRFGYVVAHEFAHSTLNTPWLTNEINSLLHRYDPATHSEAIADIVAGLGLLHSNSNSVYQLSVQRLCDHVSQTWCARTGSLYYATTGNVHPKANQRGDYFCQTLRELTG